MFDPEPWDEFDGPMLSALTFSQVQSKKQDAVKAAETLYLEEARKKCKKKPKNKNVFNDEKHVNEQSKNKKETKSEKKKNGSESKESGTNRKSEKDKNKNGSQSNVSITDGKDDEKSKKNGSQSKLSQFSSAIKGQHRLGMMTADRIRNSPGATKQLMSSDSDDACSPELKDSSKKKRKNESEGSRKTRLNSAKEMIVGAGGKLQRALSNSSNGVSAKEEDDEDVGEIDSENILTKGIKFSSQSAFLRFVGHKKAKKRKVVDREEISGNDNCGFKETPKRVTTGSIENNLGSPSKKAKKDKASILQMDAQNGLESSVKKAKREKSSISDMDVVNTSIISTTTPNGAGIDFYKLRQVLDKSDTTKTQDSKKVIKSIGEISKEKLAGARFRYLNEQLYTQPAGQSFKQFSKDQDLFRIYHSGYQQQAAQWPLDPLNVIIASCLKMPDEYVIADMGCGEARLARSVPNQVHSFDLVSSSPAVTTCEMSKTPLEAGTVDVVIFCLSLMGTSVRDFIFEAGRILKMGGTLKIAELESRFQSTYTLDDFISDVCKFGFKNSWKDVKKSYFYFVDFTKETEVRKKKKLPEINLKPCLYKKR